MAVPTRADPRGIVAMIRASVNTTGAPTNEPEEEPEPDWYSGFVGQYNGSVAGGKRKVTAKGVDSSAIS